MQRPYALDELERHCLHEDDLDGVDVDAGAGGNVGKWDTPMVGVEGKDTLHERHQTDLLAKEYATWPKVRVLRHPRRERLKGRQVTAVERAKHTDEPTMRRVLLQHANHIVRQLSDV